MALLENKLEALLFYKGEPETTKHIAKLLEVSEEAVVDAAMELGVALQTRGIRLLHVQDKLELITAPETSEVVQRARKDEVAKDLGKAGAETLAIILYRGPIARAHIEHIRGVNCASTLRNLLIRGLIERVPAPVNKRMVLYGPTATLLQHLGVPTIQELPEYQKIVQELEAFDTQHDHTQTDQVDTEAQQTPSTTP